MLLDRLFRKGLHIQIVPPHTHTHKTSWYLILIQTFWTLSFTLKAAHLQLSSLPHAISKTELHCLVNGIRIVCLDWKTYLFVFYTPSKELIHGFYPILSSQQLWDTVKTETNRLNWGFKMISPSPDFYTVYVQYYCTEPLDKVNLQ